MSAYRLSQVIYFIVKVIQLILSNILKQLNDFVYSLTSHTSQPRL